jgi:hypothetical protein
VTFLAGFLLGIIVVGFAAGVAMFLAATSSDLDDDERLR